MTRPPARATVVIALVAAALVVGGCGAVAHITGTPDASQGKKLFIANCATCHTMADAGTTGKIGPNLDWALEYDKSQGFQLSGLRDMVHGQIFYPEAPMPSKIVTGEQAIEVAQYVAQCAGVPQCHVTAAK